MSSLGIKLDISRVLTDYVGEHGLSLSELEGLADRASDAQKAVEAARGTGWLGWTELPSSKAALEESRAALNAIPFEVEDLVVLGIGGSALGLACLKNALLSPLHNTLTKEERNGAPRVWILDNIDPDWLHEHFEFLNPETTLFNVISKSGTTAETMSAYMHMRDILADKLGDRATSHIVCTTDANKGKLREIALSEGLTTLTVPDGVGGRFSVLSSVGLFPAMVLGMDVEGVLAGAANMDAHAKSDSIWENNALMQGVILYMAANAGMNIHVMLPYSNALKDYADWYCQLLGESLGKKLSRAGQIVHTGITPVKALGATDQHSQIQLYTEGPFDKLTTIIHVENTKHEVRLPNSYTELEGVSYLGGRSVAELMHAECAGTEVALTDAGRAFEVITVSEVTPSTLGELIYFNELAIAYAGELMNIDAFDQPGVEAGKRAAFALMGRAGFEELGAKLQSAPTPDEKFII